PDHRVLGQRIERDRDGEPADQLGDEPETEQVLRLDAREGTVALDGIRPRRTVEPDATLAATGLDDLLQPIEGAAADEEDVPRVDLDVILLRMLPAALRRDGGDGALQDLEQSLLHAFTRDIARDARVLRLAGDLVDLVDVDDPALALGQVEVRGLEQTDQDVLDVFTDVAGLGQHRRVRDRERDLEDARERLGEERLPRTGRPDQQDVRLLERDVVEHTLMVDALVVIVDRDGEGLLRLVLADHVLIEDLLDLARRGDARDRVGGIPLLLFGQDRVAKRDALVAAVA